MSIIVPVHSNLHQPAPRRTPAGVRSSRFVCARGGSWEPAYSVGKRRGGHMATARRRPTPVSAAAVQRQRAARRSAVRRPFQFPALASATSPLVTPEHPVAPCKKPGRQLPHYRRSRRITCACDSWRGRTPMPSSPLTSRKGAATARPAQGLNDATAREEKGSWLSKIVQK